MFMVEKILVGIQTGGNSIMSINTFDSSSAICH